MAQQNASRTNVRTSGQGCEGELTFWRLLTIGIEWLAFRMSMMILVLLGLIALVITLFFRGIARVKNDRAWALAKHDAERVLEDREKKFANSAEFGKNA